MRRGLFGKLAVQNIRNNRSTYIPYMLTCIFCIAMMYMMEFLRDCPTLEKAVPQASEVRLIVGTGEVVVGIFCVIFLIYSNSFLMKRRQKEIGLYNILGLEKGHIGKVMFLETIMTSLLSLAAGIGFGILGSKLSLLLLFRFLHVPAVLGFYVSITGILFCIAGFGGIFLVILALNLTRVRMNNPVELLKGGNTGEREPRAKWLMAFLGVICLGVGYYLAVTTESPIQAIFIFLLAVILVMAGTYLLFTAGSIVVLKVLRWNKKFYYKTKNFTAVSGMLYRMKQNAVGLASICILSTGVLLMISSTVCLNSGLDDIMNKRCPADVNVLYRGNSYEDLEKMREKLLGKIENQVSYEKINTEIAFSSTLVGSEDGSWKFANVDGSSLMAMPASLETLTVVPQEEYARVTGEEISLAPGEVLAYHNGKTDGETLEIHNKVYQVKEWLKNYQYVGDNFSSMDSLKLVVNDEDFFALFLQQEEVYQSAMSLMELETDVYLSGSEEEKYASAIKVSDLASELLDSEKAAGTIEVGMNYSTIKQELYNSFYSMFGGILFLGIFLGLLFLMGAAMIIYYKQVSEGYEDKERFEIMQKVGMTHKEVKSSIHRQILMVFFLPLGMAALHIAMAFPMVKRLLALFSMTNSGLFARCTVVTLLVFALVYGVIYGLTAKVYYKIVERK